MVGAHRRSVMSQPSTHRRRPSTSVAAVLVLAALAMATLGTAAPVAAASYPIRIEAGPQIGYHFSSSGGVPATKPRPFRSPTNTTASDRRSTGGGQHILVAAGPMAGWWVRESGVAFV